MAKFKLVEDYPEITLEQVKQFYDYDEDVLNGKKKYVNDGKNEVELLNDGTILLHGINEGRRFKLVERKEVFETEELPAIADWQIALCWNRNEYRWIGSNIVEREIDEYTLEPAKAKGKKDKVIKTGRKITKRFRVYRGERVEQTIKRERERNDKKTVGWHLG